MDMFENVAYRKHPGPFGVQLVKSDYRNRTIVVARTFEGQPYVYYKSTELGFVEYDYLANDATPSDLEDFLKRGDHYVIKECDL